MPVVVVVLASWLRMVASRLVVIVTDSIDAVDGPRWKVGGSTGSVAGGGTGATSTLSTVDEGATSSAGGASSSTLNRGRSSVVMEPAEVRRRDVSWYRDVEVSSFQA